MQFPIHVNKETDEEQHENDEGDTVAPVLRINRCKRAVIMLEERAGNMPEQQGEEFCD